MENQSAKNEAVEEIHNNQQNGAAAASGSQPHPPSSNNYQERKKDLHSKVMDITMTIGEQYPELSKYLEEMQETIPNEKDPEMALMDLKKYYDSLVDILNKYKAEHPV